MGQLHMQHDELTDSGELLDSVMGDHPRTMRTVEGFGS